MNRYCCTWSCVHLKKVFSKKMQVNASDVIIMEGILVFHDARVRELMNMKIFVDTGQLCLFCLQSQRMGFLILQIDYLVVCKLQSSELNTQDCRPMP